MSNEKSVEFNPELYKSIKEKILKLTFEGEDGGLYEDLVFNYEEVCYYDEECLEHDYEGYIERANDETNPYNMFKILKLYRNFIIKKKEETVEPVKMCWSKFAYFERLFGQHNQSERSEEHISEEPDVVKPIRNAPAEIYEWIPPDGEDGLPDFHDDEDHERYGIFVDKNVDEKVAYTFFRTYFARLCLYIGLNDPGEYSCDTYPWYFKITPRYFGFHKVWTDEELFAEAGLTDEEIAEVYRVLPD